MHFSTLASTVSTALFFALTVSAVALPVPESTSCVNGKCVTGDSSTEASSINGAESFKSDGNAGKAQGAPPVAGAGAGAQRPRAGSGAGADVPGVPDVKAMLLELSKQLGVDLTT
ncbi:MAG: hypothetical protein M1816_001098 [Peltula sp. TS41687]|nr:MAG: hypothetical protein M1816_001098 [Peltula sp. TS41687]